MTPEERDTLAEQFAEEFAKRAAAWSSFIGQPTPPEEVERQRAALLRTVVEEARRSGQPVVRGRWDGDCIVLEFARPAGFG